MRGILVWVVLGLLARAQSPAASVDVPIPAGMTLGTLAGYDSVTFSFAPRYEGAEAWAMEVHRDGTGTYKRKGGSASMAIAVSPVTLARMSGADATKFAGGGCETKAKNIAQTGLKRIAYALGPSLAACEFNYSDDERLNEAVSAFLAVAETVQAGERLKLKKRFDHLGLDRELNALVEQAKAGRAIELQNIALVLRSIAEDDELMGMVRRKATGLLEMAGAAK